MKPWTEKKQIAAALENRDVRAGEREVPDGARLRGLYAAKAFAAGDFVASYHGERLTRADLVRLHETDEGAFERFNEYAVIVPGTETFLCAMGSEEDGGHLINHSCGPNADWAQAERGAVLVRALRPIAAGEEITIHYRWTGVKAAAEGKKRHACFCTALFCTGTIELKVEWVDHGGGRGGPNLSIEEIAARFLADILNDTTANEAVLAQYGNGATKFLMGVDVGPFDHEGFWEKLTTAAEAAVKAAIEWRRIGRKISVRRLREVAEMYGITLRSAS